MWSKLVLTTFVGFVATFGSAQPGQPGDLAEVLADNGLNTLLAAALAAGQADVFSAATPGGLSKFFFLNVFN
jgi:hypothetical protein